MLGRTFHHEKTSVSEHDFSLLSILSEVFVPELEFPLGAQADGTNHGVSTKFLFVVTVPCNAVPSIPVIIDQNGIEPESRQSARWLS